MGDLGEIFCRLRDRFYRIEDNLSGARELQQERAAASGSRAAASGSEVICAG